MQTTSRQPPLYKSCSAASWLINCSALGPWRRIETRLGAPDGVQITRSSVCCGVPRPFTERVNGWLHRDFHDLFHRQATLRTNSPNVNVLDLTLLILFVRKVGQKPVIGCTPL